MPDHLLELWVWFWEIAGQRHWAGTGMGMMPLAIPIPWFTAWLDEQGVSDQDERQRYLWIWCAMDRKWRNLTNLEIADKAPPR